MEIVLIFKERSSQIIINPIKKIDLKAILHVCMIKSDNETQVRFRARKSVSRQISSLQQNGGEKKNRTLT